MSKISPKNIAKILLPLLLILLPNTFPISIATVGQHPDSETPGSDQAVIFSPFGPLHQLDVANMEFVRAKVAAHDYVVTQFLDQTEARDDNPGGATAMNFLRLSGVGIVYVISHGARDNPRTPAIEPNLLLVEVYSTVFARNTALAGYIAPAGGPFLAGDLVPCDMFRDHVVNRIRGICITEAGVARNFRDNNSIVYIAACHSFNFVEEFNSREYFGYRPTDECRVMNADAERFWGRMHGERDDVVPGQKRAARVAFDGGGFSTGFLYQHRLGSLDTVLSPAVKEHTPAKDARINVSTGADGRVVFDTRMDMTIDPTMVIRVEGCGARIVNPTWVDNFTLEFALELKEEGTATLKVVHFNAIAERDFKNKLDGNQNPVGRDHVGPNRDDYAWKIQCVRCAIATAAFGSELAPQVQFLRDFRDEHILSTLSGSTFMNVFNMWYYSFSPSVANTEREIPVLQQTIKYAIYPLLSILTVAEKAYFILSGESAAVMAGFVTSSMIGFVYFWPIAYGIGKVSRRKIDSNVLTSGIIISLIGVVIGILMAEPILLMITTSAFVLTVLSVSSIISARMINRLISEGLSFFRKV